MTDDLLARFQALSPKEQARLLAQLGADASLLNLGGAQTGEINTGDLAGRDVRKGTEGSVTLSDDARLNGVAVGVNLGRIVLGRDPAEEERRRLAWYLARLANKLYRLPLRGIEERLDQGQGVALPQVYVMLAVESNAWDMRGTPTEVAVRFEDNDLRKPLKREYYPAYALPAQAVRFWSRAEDEASGKINLRPIADLAHAKLARADQLILYRSALASEVMQWRRSRKELRERTNHLVLLGDPGSGKSTFVRYLAWALACRGLDQRDNKASLPGWEDAQNLLPIVLPLRTLAGRIAAEGAHERTVFAALREEMHACCMHQVDDLLTAALDRGTALLLFDGLDEVPLEGQPGVVASRAVTLRAVRDFVRLYERTMALLTCRTRAFDKALRDELGWIVERLQPFTLGQVRHFVPAWYGELRDKGQITDEQAERLSSALFDTIVASPKLTAMAETPLLLTMMALVLLNKGELPRDRPQLYERILELLLGQWDQVREGRSLAEAVGLADWGSERFGPLLDQLSYRAHLAGSSDDGRGRLARGDLYTALIDYFKAAQVQAPGDAALRWLDYVEQRSGLLAPDGPASYVFAHLTLQEHCAGRHIALNSDDPVALMLGHRHDDRWREPILLGAGLMRPVELNALLSELVEREGKADERWYRDLMLAAEIGKDRDWSYLRTRPMVKVDRLQRELRAGLVALLADTAQPLPVAERVRAGFLLGELGDPRFPVTPDQWRAELLRRNERFGQPTGYLCFVPKGVYKIGGWETDEPAADVSLSPFWLARFPITVAQFAPFVEQGYSAEAERWWTPEGWKWRNQRDRLAPWGWDDLAYSGANQPVIGVTWYEATAFCAWLSEQFAVALPRGYVLRLPSEAEWEAAAAYDAQMQRRTYPWVEAEPTTELAIYDASGLRQAAPVGCCPAGAAACGALDLVGNVWEMTTSSFQAYPAKSGVIKEDFTPGDFDVPFRGGSYYQNSTYVRCGARYWDPPDYDGFNFGFRFVLAPLLAQRF